MKKYLIFSISLLSSISAIAQSSLSVTEAVQIGLANNYDIQIEAKNIEIARNNNTIGEAGFLPSLALNVSQNNSRTKNATPNPFSFQGVIVNQSVNPSVILNWTLFDGFRARANKHRLENLQTETEGNASIVVQNTIQAIIQGYYNAVFEAERLEVFDKTLLLSREKYEYVELRKEFGSALTADLLLEESNYLQDSLSFVNQKFAYRNALRALNVLMAVEDVNTDYLFSNPLEHQSYDYDAETLMTKVSENNVNFKRQYISQSILRNNTRIARADMYPKIDLQLRYSDNISTQDLTRIDGLSDVPPIATGTTETFSAGFTVSYNLFNGGRIKRAIQNAVIQEQVGNIRIENLQLSLKRDLRQALDLYNTRKLLRGIAERTKESAELNLQISEERYKNGTINSFDYRTVQNNYINAALSELQATYNLIDANTQLMRLTGGIVEEL